MADETREDLNADAPEGVPGSAAVDAPAAASEGTPSTPSKPIVLTRNDKLKFAALIGIFVVLGVLTVLLIPLFTQLATDDGLASLVESIQSMGVIGVFAVLALQLIQIVIAFIPGEVVQVAAGLIYGPVFGSIVILVGCFISTVVVFYLVQKLGGPFVHKMVSRKHLDRFGFLRESSKLDLIVFLLFLIPGMPKDVLTYIVAITDIKPSHFFLLTTVARVPGVVLSTWAGASVLAGNWHLIGVIAIGALVLVGLVWFFRDRIIDRIGKHAG
jgi:uncharacterized membrane protein YdjX (TVP38/TMEM64 family)